MKKIKILILSIIAAFSLLTVSSIKAQEVNLSIFEQELSPYGQWVMHPRFGEVWVYSEPGFRPYYSNGRWEYTDYGWSWESDYEWGGIPFHYGRWENDAYYGWIWIPGYEWAPAWVSWSEYNNYYGWAPLGFGMGINIGFNDISYNNWIFIPRNNICEHDLSRYYISPNRNYGFRNAVLINNFYRNDNRDRFMRGPDRDYAQRFTNYRIPERRIEDRERQGRFFAGAGRNYGNNGQQRNQNDFNRNRDFGNSDFHRNENANQNRGYNNRNAPQNQGRANDNQRQYNSNGWNNNNRQNNLPQQQPQVRQQPQPQVQQPQVQRPERQNNYPTQQQRGQQPQQQMAAPSMQNNYPPQQQRGQQPQQQVAAPSRQNNYPTQQQRGQQPQQQMAAPSTQNNYPPQQQRAQQPQPQMAPPVRQNNYPIQQQSAQQPQQQAVPPVRQNNVAPQQQQQAQNNGGTRQAEYRGGGNVAARQYQPNQQNNQWQGRRN